jgi:hypothetical protein
MHAGNLLTALEDAGRITPSDRRELGTAIQANCQETELPLYLRVLAGVGAFIASLCIMGFLSMAKLIDFSHAQETVAWGAGFIAGGVFLARQAARTAGVALHSFVMQWSFCFVGIGKMLVTGGAMQAASGWHNEGWSAAFALAGVTAITWPFYRMSVDRYLSSAVVLLLVLFNLATDRNFGETHGLFLNGFLALQLCAAALIFTSGWVTRGFLPLGYALATGLAATALVFSVHLHKLSYQAEAFNPAFSAVLLAAALIALTGWAAGGLHRLQQEPFLIAGLGAALLGLTGAPAILLSLGFMVLGYARHDRLLMSGGALLAPVSLWFYYYSLDLTLFAKAAVLIGSGAVLLAGRGYMRLRNFDKEG